MSQQAERMGWQAQPVDMAIGGLRHDLTDPAVVQELCGNLRAGMYTLVIMAPPCQTFSVFMRLHPELSTRSYEQPGGGRDGRTPTAREATANAIARVCVALARAAEDNGTPWIWENPSASLMWRYRPVRDLVASTDAPRFTGVFDWCQYGRPWKKRTRLEGSAPFLPALARRCTGDHEHTPLVGSARDPEDNARRPMTAIAARYSDEFCREVLRLATEHLKTTVCVTIPTQPSSDSLTALVVEEMPRIATQLGQQGWRTIAFHPRALASTDTHDVNGKIHAGAFHLVWLEVPSGGHAVPPRKLAPALREMALWTRTAKTTHQCQALLTGPRSRVWQNPDLQRLPADGVVTEHRFASCQTDVRDRATGKWSPMEMHAYSTTPLHGAACRCPRQESHAPWDTSRSGRMGARAYQQETLDEWYGKLVPAIVDQLGTCTGLAATTAEAYPTEARLRAKAREKAGYKAKKQAKPVEAHSDDLGDDLAGLGPGLEYLGSDVLPVGQPRHSDTERARSQVADCFIQAGLTGTADLRKPPRHVHVARGPAEAAEHLGPNASPAIWEVSGGDTASVAIRAARTDEHGVSRHTCTTTTIASPQDGSAILHALWTAGASIVMMTLSRAIRTPKQHEDA